MVSIGAQNNCVSAYQCSGADRELSFEESFEKATVVVRGKVIQLDPEDYAHFAPGETKPVQAKAVIEVSESFKGTQDKLLTIVADPQFCDHVKLQKGKEYIVFANRRPEGLVAAGRNEGTEALYDEDDFTLNKLKALKNKK